MVRYMRKTRQHNPAYIAVKGNRMTIKKTQKKITRKPKEWMITTWEIDGIKYTTEDEETFYFITHILKEMRACREIATTHKKAIDLMYEAIRANQCHRYNRSKYALQILMLQKIVRTCSLLT